MLPVHEIREEIYKEHPTPSHDCPENEICFGMVRASGTSPLRGIANLS